MTGNVTLTIMNPLKSNIKAAIINITFDSILLMRMNSNFNISGSINNLTLSASGFRAYFKTQETLLTLSKKAHTIEQIIMQQLNRVLLNGLKLPFQDNIWSNDMNNSSFEHFNSYLYGDTEPNILNNLNIDFNDLQGAMKSQSLFISEIL